MVPEVGDEGFGVIRDSEFEMLEEPESEGAVDTPAPEKILTTNEIGQNFKPYE